MMSNSDELRQVNISFVKLDKELKTDWTKSSPGDIAFVSADRELKIDIKTLTGVLCIFHR